MMNQNPDFTVIQSDFEAQRWKRAEAGCLSVLRQSPKDLPTLQLLAKIQSAQGDYRGAIATIEKAISVSPNNADLYRQCGDMHFNSRQFKSAIGWYRKADSKLPNNPQIKNNLAVALRDSGSIEEAIAIFESIISANPDHSLPHRNLGDVLRMQGEFDRAIDKYKAAAKLDPKDAATQNSIGITFSMVGKVDEAILHFQLAVDINQTFPEAENNLANALLTARRYEDAIRHATTAIRLRPHFPNAHLTLGNIYKLQGNNKQAISEYKKAAELDPGNAILHQSIGSAMTDAGHFPEAITHLEKALQLKPNFFVVYQNLVALAVQEKYDFSDYQIKRIIDLSSERGLPSADVSRLNFTLGSLLEKKGDYDAAMSCFQKANMSQEKTATSRGLPFDGHAHADFIDNIIHSFNAALMGSDLSSGHPTQRPIFVVGMPRSGTTLVEQIIASHPLAAGVGELPDVAYLADELSKKHQAEYPSCIEQAEAEQLFKLANQYDIRISELCPDAERIADKMPDNFLRLGLIALLFPNAHIIHCKRNPLDICLSCYKSDFGGVRWAGSLKNISQYFIQYHRLMEHWHQVLPLQIHDIFYEDLVTQHEVTAEKLIAACGLNWHDLCLDFYKGDGTVRTLSRVQVRQPIYDSSIGSWKHYEEHLRPLRENLHKELGTEFS